MGGKSPKTVTTQTQLPSWMTEHATNLLNRGEAASLIPYQAPPNAVAPLQPAQQAGLSALYNRALGGFPGQGQAYANYAGTLGGNFMGSNPWLDSMYNRAANSITDQYRYGTEPFAVKQAIQQDPSALSNSGFNQARQFRQYDLGENLANLATSIYGGNYDAERQRQLQALALTPQLANLGYQDANALLQAGGLQQQQAQNLLTQGRQDWMNEFQYPQNQLNFYAGLLSGNPGAKTGSQQQPYFPGSTASGLFGTGILANEFLKGKGGKGLSAALPGAGIPGQAFDAAAQILPFVFGLP